MSLLLIKQQSRLLFIFQLWSVNFFVFNQITNEWKKSFVIPYTPRHTVTKLVNATIQPPKLELLDVEESRENLKQHKLNRSSLRHRKEQAYRYAGKSQQHTTTPRHVGM